MSDERLIELMTEVRDLVKEQRDDAREHMAHMAELAGEQHRRMGLVMILVKVALAIVMLYVGYIAIAFILMAAGSGPAF